MRTDYKFWFIRRDDNDFIEEAAIRFYEGDYEEVEDTETKEKRIVYKRYKILNKTDLVHLGTGFIKDSNNNDVRFYTSADFGNIKTDDDLRKFLNKELKKDMKREAIEEQK